MDQAVSTSPIMAAQAALRAKRASGEAVTTERLNPVERAQRFPKSLRKAITAHCWQCCGAGADPGVKQGVRDCKIKDCALWSLRPWQKVLGKSADQMSEAEFETAAGGSDESDDMDEDE